MPAWLKTNLSGAVPLFVAGASTTPHMLRKTEMSPAVARERFQNSLLSSSLYVEKHETIVLKSIELLSLLMLDHPAKYKRMCLLDRAEVLSIVQPANLKMIELQIFGRCWQAKLEDILSTELSPLYKYLLRGSFVVR